MSDALVGTSTIREVRLEVDGVPTNDAVLNYSLQDPLAAQITLFVNLTAVGDGWYQVPLAGTLLTVAGKWTGTWSGFIGSDTVEVDDYFLVLPWRPQLMTRRELRHAISRQLDDLTLGRFSSATAATFTDGNLIDPDPYWRGAWVLPYAGPGKDQERRIASGATAGACTIGRAWDTLPTSATYYELHRLWAPSVVNDAIDTAILTMHPGGTAPIVDLADETQLGAADQYEYAIPAGFDLLYGVEFKSTTDPTADWFPLRPGRTGWTVRPGRRLRLAGTAETYRLRLRGRARPDRLARDTAWCDVLPGYVIHQACALLLLQKARGPEQDVDAYAQRATWHQQQADRLRPSASIPNDSVRVA